MIQEEKARAYDEAIERINNVDRLNHMTSQEIKDYLFPRFCESEDEKIRKRILQLVTADISQDDITDYENRQMRAYLEKQKEPGIKWIKSDNVKNPDKPYIDKAGMFYTTDGRMCQASEIETLKEQNPSTEETELNSVAFLEQLGYTCIPPGTLSTPEDIAAAYQMGLSKGRNEQKPAEWSEEDKRFIKDLCNLLAAIAKNNYVGCYYAPDLINKIQSLHPQSKQEWSEEDKAMLNAAIEMVENSNTIFCFEVNNHKVSNWLKSLRPQPKQDVLPSLSEKEIICLKRALDYLRKEHNRYGGEDFTNEIVVLEWLITHPILVSNTHWKPSPEQMEALSDAYVEASTFKMGDILESLYNDLKKL